MSPEERAAGVKVLKDMNFRDAIYLGSFKDRFMEQVRAPVGGWCRWRLVVVAVVVSRSFLLLLLLL